jgi:hypothetical protein
MKNAQCARARKRFSAPLAGAGRAEDSHKTNLVLKEMEFWAAFSVVLKSEYKKKK